MIIYFEHTFTTPSPNTFYEHLYEHLHEHLLAVMGSRKAVVAAPSRTRTGVRKRCSRRCPQKVLVKVLEISSVI